MPLYTFLIAALLLFMPKPALAFGECSTAAYAAHFNETGPVTGCEWRRMTPLRVNGHSRDVRIFRLNGSFHGDDAEWISTINDLIDRVSFAANALGPRLNVQNVSILLADHRGRGEDRGAHAVTQVGTGLSDECPIVVYKTGRRVSTLEFGKLLAHELFHCMQDATWSDAAATPEATWWVEGSAEYFAQLVVPESPSSQGFISQYVTQSPQTSLNAHGMDYETVVFFDWLHGQRGGDGVMQVLNALATSGGTVADLQRIVPDADWADLIEKFVTDSLTEPGGRPIRYGAVQLYNVVDRDSREIALSTDAYRGFVLELRFPNPGRYQVSVTGSATLQAKLRWADGGWVALPFQVDACGDPSRAVLYAVSTTGPEDFTVAYQRVEDCSACQRSTLRDSCLVGNWTLTGGGAVEWLRENGMGNRARVETGEMSMQLRRNGQFVTAPLSVLLQTDIEGSNITGTGTGPGSTGIWGAGDGALMICPQTGGGKAVVQHAGGSQTMLFGPGGDMQMRYTCAGATLTTSLDISAGLPPMVSTYTRN